MMFHSFNPTTTVGACFPFNAKNKKNLKLNKNTFKNIVRISTNVVCSQDFINAKDSAL